MKVEIVVDRTALQPLARRWDELARLDTRDGFFRTFVWYASWLDHVRPDAEPFVLVVRDPAGTIVGIAPMCRLRYRDNGFRSQAIAWAGREVVSGDFLDFVTDPRVRREAVQAMISTLHDTPERSTLLVIGELLDGGESYRAFEQMGERYGHTVRRQEERVCPYIALPKNFDDYLSELGTSTRYHIRRRMRDVEKRGATVVTHTDPEAIVARLGTLVELHLARWRKDQQPGTFGRPGFVPFLRQVFLNPPQGAAWRMYELSHLGRTTAALLTFYYGQSALYYQAGWDPDSELSPLSPGVVLMAHSIRDAIEQRLQYYEFLRGDEAYKSRWTKTHRTTATLLLARGTIARAYLHALGLKDSIKHHFQPVARTQLAAAEQVPNVE